MGNLVADSCSTHYAASSVPATKPVKLLETSGDLNYLCRLLGLDGRAWLVTPYPPGQSRARSWWVVSALDFLVDEDRLKRHDLSDAGWARLEPLLPGHPRQGHRWNDHRQP